MSNQLSVTINNVELPIKEYQGQKVVTLREVDAVHNRPEGTARRNFNTNKKHLLENTDFFIITQPDEIRTLGLERPQGGTPESVTLLTESGYLMLVKSFTDDLAWDVQRQLVNTYFASTPNQCRKAAKQTKSAEEIAIANKRAVAMLLNAKNRTATSLQKLYDRAGIKPEYQAQALSAFYAVDGVNLPRIALHCRNGHNGEDYEYTESVVEKVRSWLDEHGYPVPLSVGGKNYNVLYDDIAYQN